MQHVRAVDELQAAQDLVHEVLRVLVGQPLRRCDDALQVALEELGDDVERVEVFSIRRAGHQVENFNDVVVAAEVAQKLDLTQDAFGVDEVVEHPRHALNGDLRKAKQMMITQGTLLIAPEALEVCVAALFIR